MGIYTNFIFMTEKQLQFFQLLADGFTIAEAAETLQANKRTLEKWVEKFKKQYTAYTLSGLLIKMVRAGEIK